MRNRLFWDIETCPNVILDFACGYNKHVGYNQIIEERKIICICYKWEHSPKVYSLEWDSKKCDKKMIKEFVKVLDKADESIGHNIDKFDLKWLRGRAIKHKIAMRPDYVTVDTLRLARMQFNLNSNRLDYLSKFLGSKGKISTNWQMWVDITLYNKKSALKDMVKYCKQDVTELERVFKKINPYALSKTKVSSDKLECPEGHSNFKISNRRISASGSRSVCLQCKTCGKYWSLSEPTYNKLTK